MYLVLVDIMQLGWDTSVIVHNASKKTAARDSSLYPVSITRTQIKSAVIKGIEKPQHMDWNFSNLKLNKMLKNIPAKTDIHN